MYTTGSDYTQKKLNKALTSKIFELQKYRSEFFGKLQSLLGDRQDIKIVGDRFIFDASNSDTYFSMVSSTENTHALLTEGM